MHVRGCAKDSTLAPLKGVSSLVLAKGYTLDVQWIADSMTRSTDAPCWVMSPLDPGSQLSCVTMLPCPRTQFSITEH